MTTSNFQKPLKRLWILAALALAGIAVSISLSQHYYELHNGTAGFKSFCNVNQVMNCDAVAASRFAEILPGFPLASFAGGWLLALFFVTLIAQNPFWRRESERFIFGLATGGLLFSILYFLVMAAVLHTYCLYCLILDALNVGIFAIALSLRPQGFGAHKAETDKWKKFAILLALCILVSAGSLKAFDNSHVDTAEADQMFTQVVSAPVVSVNAGPEFPSMGNPNAPITIVEFSDFQCPYCRIGSFYMNSLLKQYPDLVRVVFRAYPLDPSCNRMVTHSMHPVACEAAKTALCASKQGKFQPVYESLFENQSTLNSETILTYAQDAGADLAALKTCRESSDALLAVTRDIEEGTQLGVESTPTFFINGHKVDGVYPIAVWTKLIEKFSNDIAHATH